MGDIGAKRLRRKSNSPTQTNASFKCLFHRKAVQIMSHFYLTKNEFGGIIFGGLLCHFSGFLRRILRFFTDVAQRLGGRLKCVENAVAHIGKVGKI